MTTNDDSKTKLIAESCEAELHDTRKVSRTVGRYEQAFLNEIRKGAPHLICEVHDVGSIEYRVPYVTTKFRETDYQPVTTVKTKKTKPRMECKHCKREQPEYYIPEIVGLYERKSDGVTVVHHEFKAGWVFHPCPAWKRRCLKAEDPLLKIIVQQCGFVAYRTWKDALTNLWDTAVRIDLNILDANRRVSHAKLEEELIQPKFGRQIINRITCCLLL